MKRPVNCIDFWTRYSCNVPEFPEDDLLRDETCSSMTV